METRLHFEIGSQPDNFTCGPTCLQAVYDFYSDPVPLSRVVQEVSRQPNGGTLAVDLGCHALSRGYSAHLYTYNLQLFDPTWFNLDAEGIDAKLVAQARVKRSARLRDATQRFRTYLKLGGTLGFDELSGRLLSRYLNRGIPILTGLSSTYLYSTMRERDEDAEDDDIAGLPCGHFVVLCGYDASHRSVLVADPQTENPFATPFYVVGINRLVCAIMLGVLTYDANLLILQPNHFPAKN